MGKKILVIEDIQINLTLFMMHLKKSGYEVQGALNGKEGLKLAKVMSFDLIICDLKLPDFEGSTLINFLRAEDRLKYIPILVISAQTLEEAKVNTEHIQAYLHKPVQPGILIQKVREILPNTNGVEEANKAKLEEIEMRASQRKNVQVKVIDGFPVETVLVSNLKPGMETGDDVTDNNNSVVMPKGIPLNDKLIEKLHSLEITEILIRK